MQELSHDLGNFAPPGLDEWIQEVSGEELISAMKALGVSYRPWIISREGSVTSHEEADQQRENDQFCLHPGNKEIIE